MGSMATLSANGCKYGQHGKQWPGIQRVQPRGQRAVITVPGARGGAEFPHQQVGCAVAVTAPDIPEGGGILDGVHQVAGIRGQHGGVLGQGDLQCLLDTDMQFGAGHAVQAKFVLQVCVRQKMQILPVGMHLADHVADDGKQVAHGWLAGFVVVCHGALTPVSPGMLV